KIDAVEIDEDAFMQAKENIANTIWKENIQGHRQSIQSFSRDKNEQYDLIFSNPPFFENDLKSVDEQKNKALHSSKLSLKELVEIVYNLLREKGMFCVLLPYLRTEYFIGLAEKENLFLHKKYLIKQTPQHNYFRSILFFTKDISENVTEIITIKEEKEYSLRFSELLRDYYLYL
ncbi:MAG TPA: RsmD family RNA methyltransferase, partial [Arachidicoccus sp.]